MQVVAVDERHPDLVGDSPPDRGLARTGHPHHDKAGRQACTVP
jgi:hypothetical protein